MVEEGDDALLVLLGVRVEASGVACVGDPPERLGLVRSRVELLVQLLAAERTPRVDEELRSRRYASDEVFEVRRRRVVGEDGDRRRRGCPARRREPLASARLEHLLADRTDARSLRDEALSASVSPPLIR